MGWASGFQAGSRLAGDILDTYNQAKQKREFEEIAKATPGLTYTEGQGQQLQAIAEAKREDGTPYYSLTTDPQTGQYIVQSNFENAQGLTGEATKYTPGGQSFLGRTYDQGTPLTQQQMDRARMEAYAEAISKSDPIQGLRMRRELAAEDRATTAEQRAATAEQRAAIGFETGQKLAGFQVKAAERQEKRDESVDTLTSDIQAFSKKFVTNEDGTPRQPTADEQMKIAQYSATRQFAAGNAAEGARQLTALTNASLATIQLQTAQRNEELLKAIPAVQTGNLKAAQDFYNKYTPDGAKVTSIKTNKDGSLTIKRQSDTGQALPDTFIPAVRGADGNIVPATQVLVAQMQTFKDPMAFQNFVQQNLKDDLARQVSESAIAANKLKGKEAEAQISGLNLEKKEKEAVIKLRDEFLNLSKDPRVNAARMREIASELAVVAPKFALTQAKVKDAEGNESIVVVNKFDSIVSNSLRAAGVIELPQQAKGALQAAAVNARGNPQAFLRSNAAQSALRAGVDQNDLLQEFMTPNQAPARQNQGLVRNFADEVPTLNAAP
jgi:hypothetical protein